MSKKDPYIHYYEQHNCDVDEALARRRKQKPVSPPEDPGDPENPWSKAGHNVTAQMRFTQTDPAEAQRLCEAAGQKWVPPHDYYRK